MLKMDQPIKKKPSVQKEFQISKEGSLGLLALGDIGLEAWRAVRDQQKKEA